MDIEEWFTDEFLWKIRHVKIGKLERIIEDCDFLIDNYGDHNRLLSYFNSCYASFGVCAVVGISNEGNEFCHAIASTFPNAYNRPINSWSKNNFSTIDTQYPIGGFAEFMHRDFRVRWDNPRRKDYAIHVRNFCRKLIEVRETHQPHLDVLRFQINNA